MALKKGTFLRILVGILVFLGLARIALPYVVLHYANNKLAHLDGYYGHIGDINIALYRGAYVMRNVYIDKIPKGSEKRSEFFKGVEIDLSVDWMALFEGKLVGEVAFEKPVIRYTHNSNIGKNIPDDTTDFIQVIKDFMPLRIHSFDVRKGEIHYVDESTKPRVDVAVTNLFIYAGGFTNKSTPGVLLPANIRVDGNLYDGELMMQVKLDPLSRIPVFDLDAKLTVTNLIKLNPFLQAYGNFDLKRGNMSVFSEFAAKDMKFKGYVKPIVKNLDVVQFNREEGNVPQVMWEAFVGGTAEVFQNQPKGRLATKIPMNGQFANPDVQTLDAILYVLKNAFIQALVPAIENSVNIYNVVKKEKKDAGIFGIFRSGKD